MRVTAAAKPIQDMIEEDFKSVSVPTCLQRLSLFPDILILNTFISGL